MNYLIDNLSSTEKIQDEVDMKISEKSVFDKIYGKLCNLKNSLKIFRPLWGRLILCAAWKIISLDNRGTNLQQIFVWYAMNYADTIRNLEVRKDDIFVVSFPKNDTTWTQELVWLLMNNSNFKKASKVPFKISRFNIIYVKKISRTLQFHSFITWLSYMDTRFR